MKKIGLFGGTCDPIHEGHINLALRVLDTFSLDEIIFIPAGNPPHKESGVSSDKLHRYRMTEIATAHIPRFSVSDYEIKKTEKNYSYHTISHFKALYPDDEIYFIVGGDSFYDFPKWYNYKELVFMCPFIVASRPGVLKEQYFERFKGDDIPPRVLYLNDVAFDISSTDIRKKLKMSALEDGLLAPEVLDYIKANNLYT